MGACFDEMILDGKLSMSEVKKRFEDHQSACAEESGNSYSGRLNMCDGLIFADKEFDSSTEADAYLQKTCQKWEEAVAVKHKESNPVQPDAKLTKMHATRQDLEHKLRVIESEVATRVEEQLKSVEFVKCSTCKSKLDTRFRAKTLRCPVCNGSFASKSDLKRVLSMRTKIEDLTKKISAHRDALQAKANAKPRKTVWLIGGLCSS